MLQRVEQTLEWNTAFLDAADKRRFSASAGNRTAVVQSESIEIKKQLENVECFKYLGSMLTNDGR